jgi:hypothetical protein
MKNHRRAGMVVRLVAVGTALAGWMGAAVAERTDVQTVNLAPHESASGPGSATLILDEVIDSRCRAAERCSPSDAASRDAVARVTLRTADGQRYAGTLAIGGTRGQPSPSAPAYAKLGHLLVELVGIAPEGRELPADGPGRLQRAILRITPAERVAVGAGAAVELQLAGFKLRVLSINDQRCPKDVMCGSAGYVQIEVELSARNAPAERLTFGSPTVPKQALAWQGYDIELCDVLPRRASFAKGALSSPLQAEFFISPAPVALRGSSAAHVVGLHTCVQPIL